MKYNYSFWDGNKFIGAMVLDSDITAQKVANGCGATDFENDITETKYKKCLGCGEWEKADDLIKGLCFMCNYQQRIQEFIDFIDGELNKAFEGKTNLFNECFTLTFKDMALKLPYGAIQYNNILICLEKILKENKEI